MYVLWAWNLSRSYTILYNVCTVGLEPITILYDIIQCMYCGPGTYHDPIRYCTMYVLWAWNLSRSYTILYNVRTVGLEPITILYDIVQCMYCGPGTHHDPIRYYTMYVMWAWNPSLQNVARVLVGFMGISRKTKI